MERWSVGRGPLLRAATELARASWCAADGLCVIVLGTCPLGARSVPAWGRSSDPDAARARFLAWPFASAVVLSVDDEAVAARAAAALRETARTESSTIALVVTAGDHAIDREPWGRDLSAAFKRWTRALGDRTQRRTRRLLRSGNARGGWRCRWWRGGARPSAPPPRRLRARHPQARLPAGRVGDRGRGKAPRATIAPSRRARPLTASNRAGQVGRGEQPRPRRVLGVKRRSPKAIHAVQGGAGGGSRSEGRSPT